MKYSEYVKLTGSRFANDLEYGLCRALETNVKGIEGMELSELCKVNPQVQRSLVGSLLLHPDWFTLDLRTIVLQICQNTYDRHCACQSARIVPYGVSCDCGSYYNPMLKASEIYGKRTAELWEVP